MKTSSEKNKTQIEEIIKYYEKYKTDPNKETEKKLNQITRKYLDNIIEKKEKIPWGKIRNTIGTLILKEFYKKVQEKKRKNNNFTKYQENILSYCKKPQPDPLDILIEKDYINNICTPYLNLD